MAAQQSRSSAQHMPVATIRADQRQIWFVGSHGGAGASTLAHALPGAADAGRYWPCPESAATERSKVVLVARSNANGLRSAQRALQQWTEELEGGIEVLGLAIVADAPGRLPRQLRELQDLVASCAPKVWLLPWIESLRFGDELDADSAPPPFRRLFEELTDLAVVSWVDTLRTITADDTV